MSAPNLNLRQAIKAFSTSEMIGVAFYSARRKAGHRQADVERIAGVPIGSISAFERGRQKNVKLGTIVKMLEIYGLSIAVVRTAEFARKGRAA